MIKQQSNLLLIGFNEYPESLLYCRIWSSYAVLLQYLLYGNLGRCTLQQDQENCNSTYFLASCGKGIMDCTLYKIVNNFFD